MGEGRERARGIVFGQSPSTRYFFRLEFMFHFSSTLPRLPTSSKKYTYSLQLLHKALLLGLRDVPGYRAYMGHVIAYVVWWTLQTFSRDFEFYGEKSDRYSRFNDLVAVVHLWCQWLCVQEKEFFAYRTGGFSDKTRFSGIALAVLGRENDSTKEN